MVRPEHAQELVGERFEAPPGVGHVSRSFSTQAMPCRARSVYGWSTPTSAT